jgi:hypothetical protein
MKIKKGIAMAAIVDINELLHSMSPKLQPDEYVFCTLPKDHELFDNYLHLTPLASFNEAEGVTLILTQQMADKAKLMYESVFKQITLTVHSSLDAVGLTAAVATQLAKHDISANVVAAYYHDHIFIQAKSAQQAMAALTELSSPSKIRIQD